MGKMRDATVVGEIDVKRPLVKPRRRLSDNIKMHLKAIYFLKVWIRFTWPRIGTICGLL
jgi:hypothetical protein